ncbi:MAG: hypothetical protein M3Q58_09535 [Bacteroidota bacterium]|nr:hypothetical protein [Bacteroidota bacterium]
MLGLYKLPGYQLNVEGQNELIDIYDAHGVPRYYIIDKNGIIVNNDAPRPSNPQAEEIILDLIKN